ncbi:unnamed protein product, partial [Ectocarpus sp. 4 AP-2014]
FNYVGVRWDRGCNTAAAALEFQQRRSITVWSDRDRKFLAEARPLEIEPCSLYLLSYLRGQECIIRPAEL